MLLYGYLGDQSVREDEGEDGEEYGADDDGDTPRATPGQP